jgi:ABC-type glycerol-3-phosphate transport system substrate-binding protein
MITTTHDSDLQEPGHVQPKAKSRIGLIIASSTVVGKFGVAPLPGLNGPGVSTLGGHKLAIGTYAADFIKYVSSEEVAKAATLATGQPMSIGPCTPIRTS